MIVDVGLAGIRLPWRFGRSEALASWIEGRPWTGRGGVLSVGVSGPNGAEKVADAVVSNIRQLEGARFGREVIVQTCETDVSPIDGLSQVRAWLELGTVATPEERLRTTALALAEAERVWLARHHGGDVRTVADALATAIETVNKRDPRAHATVLLLCNGSSADSVLDLRRGVPLDNPGWTGGLLASWDRYVHHRIAWESGGDVDRATRWQDAAASIRAGDDTALESRLNTLADAEWLALSPAVRQLVVGRLRTPLPIAAVEGWVADPQLEPLAWAPAAVWSPVPWLARAILRSVPHALPSRGALRAALTCAPLREAVVARCLSWEAELRGALVPTGGPPDRATTALSQFISRRGPDRAWYPADCPAAPTTGWEFATMGDFLQALPRTQLHATMHDVRELRNAMLHGHYVSWATLQALDGCAAALRRTSGS